MFLFQTFNILVVLLSLLRVRQDYPVRVDNDPHSTVYDIQYKIYVFIVVSTREKFRVSLGLTIILTTNIVQYRYIYLSISTEFPNSRTKLMPSRRTSLLHPATWPTMTVTLPTSWMCPTPTSSCTELTVFESSGILWPTMKWPPSATAAATWGNGSSPDSSRPYSRQLSVTALSLLHRLLRSRSSKSIAPVSRLLDPSPHRRPS